MTTYTVCLVDDDEIYRYLSKKEIEFTRAAHEILTFNDGDEALTFLQNNIKDKESLPDIIFLDINMPQVDGWDFMREFVKIKDDLAKRITIYMMSSSIDEADIQKAKSIAEISDYMIKPVNKTQYLKIFENLDKMVSCKP